MIRKKRMSKGIAKILSGLLVFGMVAGLVPAVPGGTVHAKASEISGQDVTTEPHTHCVCGTNDLVADNHTTHGHITWKGVSSLSDINGDGYYYLTQSVNLDTTWECNYNVKLCLNGNSIIENGNSSDLFTILINSGKNFILTDCKRDAGKITHAYNVSGIGVSNKGNFTMYNGKISDNTAGKSWIGGGGVLNTGNFTMYGGTICNNIASNGGGVFNQDSCTFTMYGGTISGNTATGGVYDRKNSGGGVYNKGTFNMSGGIIGGTLASDGNRSMAQGGGVFNTRTPDGGVVNMRGTAKISGNQSDRSGGGVRNLGEFNMSENASITNNTVSYGGGGGICNDYNSENNNNGIQFNMSGGSITNNNVDKTSSSGGGGVSTWGTDTVILSGVVNITGNKVGTADNNLYVYEGRTVSANNLAAGSNIGIFSKAENVGKVVVTGSADTSIFTSDDTRYKLETSGNDLKLMIKPETYTVTITLPDSVQLSSSSLGSLIQAVEKGNGITDIVLETDGSHYFSSSFCNSYQAYGIEIKPNDSLSAITISGTPNQNVNIDVVATEKEKQDTPVVEGNAPMNEGSVGYIHGTTNEMEYCLKGTDEWKDCQAGDGIGEPVEAGNTYQVRRKADITKLPSDITEVYVPKYGQTIADIYGVDYTYDGQEHAGVTLGENYVVVSGRISATDAGSYVVNIKPVDGKTWSNGTTDIREITWRINKVDQVAPTDLIGVKISAIGTNDGKITGVTETMEYSRAGENVWISCAGTEITGLSAGNYEVRYKGDNNHNESAAIMVTVSDGVAPTIVNGANGTYIQGGQDGLAFRSDAAFATFCEVLVDGNKVAPENYTAREGSIIVTLKPEYLSTLSAGTHSISIVSTSGTASTNFTVQTASTPTPNPNPEPTPTPTPGATTTTPDSAPATSTPATSTTAAPASAAPAQVTYDILDGAGSSWTQNTDGSLAIRGSGEISKFREVKVDGVTVDPVNYTVTEGSTIITFKPEYLKSLSAGNHSFELVWTDGTAATNFTVAENADQSAKSPKTGEDFSMALCTALLMVSCAGLAGMFVRRKKSSLR